MYDTVIIGAGMSGLAAGIRLAYYDRNVCILERHSEIGGLNSFYRLRGRNYDVGLHAVTNYTPLSTKKGPLARILRQLRFRWEDLALTEQIGSLIAFPGVSLRFDNRPELLEAEIARAFPDQIDNYRRLLEQIADYDDITQENFGMSTRRILGEIFDEPLLVEMLLCPLMWYGNARRRDMDFGSFCIMFRSVFLEGFARPAAGVRHILRQMVHKFRRLGGTLKMRAPVERIVCRDGRAACAVLENGEQIEAKNFLSSAGWLETMRLCDPSGDGKEEPVVGDTMSFTETVSVLDVQPRRIGHGHTIVFFNDSEKFEWDAPERLCDLKTGVICSPNNFAYTDREEIDRHLPDGIVRITSIADYEGWRRLEPDRYALEKLRWHDRIVESAVRFVPDYRRHVIDTDMFTPTTIERFTRRERGAVYGIPEKRLDGATPIGNLFICGTDQGYVGIVGSIMSGIGIANRYLLV